MVEFQYFVEMANLDETMIVTIDVEILQLYTYNPHRTMMLQPLKGVNIQILWVRRFSYLLGWVSDQKVQKQLIFMRFL